MTTPTFQEVFGDLIRLGLIEPTEPGKWRPTAEGVRAAQKVIYTILACPNDGRPDELACLETATAILGGLAKELERERR